MLIPLVSFSLYFTGILLFLVDVLNQRDNDSLMTHLLLFFSLWAPKVWIQLILCYFEVFFFNLSAVLREEMKALMLNLDLDSPTSSLCHYVENVLNKLKTFHECFAVFLLLDLSYMTLLWIFNLYSFYVQLGGQSSLFTLSYVMVLLAQLWRVLSITTECTDMEKIISTFIDCINDRLYMATRHRIVGPSV